MKNTNISVYAAVIGAVLCSACSKEEKAVEKVEELPVVTVDVAHCQSVPQSNVYTATVPHI